jgi:predicted membrane metal-binding protein
MPPTSALHEDLTRDETVTPGSDRSFGLVFAGVFAVVALGGLWRQHHLRTWALVLSILFLAVALFAPGILAPLNAVWARVGMVLHRITSPIILGLMYAVAIVPVGLVMRWKGHDPMHRSFDPTLPSYWIARMPPGPSPDSVTRQY